jgi:hypothetical protein
MVLPRCGWATLLLGNESPVLNSSLLPFLGGYGEEQLLGSHAHGSQQQH